MKLKPSKKKIAFAGPSITQKEIDYVIDGTNDGFYESFNKYTKRLEKTVCEYTGATFGIATHCCTLALHLACACLGLKKGDEVIVTDFSWVATAYAISYTGATPVFVDIDPDTWCIDPTAIKKAITKKTKAIMLVHAFGHPADMDEINSIAKEYNLKLIEDAAPALGARYKGKSVGALADIGCFSFQGAKIAVSGEGGIFLTNDEKIYLKAKHLASMGRNDSVKRFWSDEVGYQYTIANLTAALALAQVERIDELVANKRRIFNWYKNHLKLFKGIKLIEEKEGCYSNYAYPSFLITGKFSIKRDELLKKLQELNIHCRPAFPRMSRFPTFSQPPRYKNPVSTLVEKQGVSLPSAHNLEEKDIDFVYSALRYYLK